MKCNVGGAEKRSPPFRLDMAAVRVASVGPAVAGHDACHCIAATRIACNETVELRTARAARVACRGLRLLQCKAFIPARLVAHHCHAARRRTLRTSMPGARLASSICATLGCSPRLHECFTCHGCNAIVECGSAVAWHFLWYCCASWCLRACWLYWCSIGLYWPFSTLLASRGPTRSASPAWPRCNRHRCATMVLPSPFAAPPSPRPPRCGAAALRLSRRRRRTAPRLRTLYTAYLASHTGTPGPARPRLKVAR